MEQGEIVKVSGPLVVAKGLKSAKMYEVVRVSEERLMGEILELRGDRASIQVYEDTTGLGPGEPVYATGAPLSVELGPGLIESIFDGVQRPLDKIMATVGNFIRRGIEAPALDREKYWPFDPAVKKGQQVGGGDILGTVRESPLVLHKVMVPPGVEGEVIWVKEGEFPVEEEIAEVKGKDKVFKLKMFHSWPVRRPRPYREKLIPLEPLMTGQRVIDAFFPLTKGGTACVPGPFGSGKTVVQHQLAKWSDADIIVYIGCGERGNEMTDVLIEFPKLQDPHSGEPLMKRTVLVANTSNMPVAAREASIYTGITMAEYFRDMGYRVAVMADSTSRWAEALREISGRMEEMPGEEGYPAYLPTRAAEFYERAGRVHCLGSDDRREGSVSVIGSISPPGGDLSDPVVQATLKVVKVFWSLEDWLAYERHFPAINWLTSYSLYHDNLEDYYVREIGSDWPEMRKSAMALLQQESELKEIARLVGLEALSDSERLVLETAKSIREDFLQQNAFLPVDTYTSFKKQYSMLKAILHFHAEGMEAIEKQVPLEVILKLPVRQDIAQAKFFPEEEAEVNLKEIMSQVSSQTENLLKKSGKAIDEE